jgi:2-oxo-hept-3-ene-1,7-dioate hydratase
MATPPRALSAEQARECAVRIDDAERHRLQIRQLSIEHPEMTIEDAYAVQREWVSMKLERGGRLRGRKVGLTSRAMQMSSQIDEPDYGDLLEDMFFDDGTTVPAGRFIVPRVEVELAFVLRGRLAGPDCTLDAVLSATDYVQPAIEIIDARIQQVDPATGTPRRVTDTISDNAANAGVVLGGRRISPSTADLRWIPALCYRNAVIEESGVSAAVLGHPANGVAWLANKLATYGRALDPGHVVLAGSFIRPIPARSGDEFRADFGSLGSISLRFA